MRTRAGAAQEDASLQPIDLGGKPEAMGLGREIEEEARRELKKRGIEL